LRCGIAAKQRKGADCLEDFILLASGFGNLSWLGVWIHIFLVKYVKSAEMPPFPLTCYLMLCSSYAQVDSFSVDFF